MSIEAFQKVVTVNFWMFNNLLLNKTGAMVPQCELAINKLIGYFETIMKVMDITLYSQNH